jgi:hypothetical protein
VHAHGVLAEPGHLGAQLGEHAENDVDLQDARHAVQHAGLLGQQRGDEFLGGGVLRAGRFHRAAQRYSAGDAVDVAVGCHGALLTDGAIHLVMFPVPNLGCLARDRHHGI